MEMEIHRKITIALFLANLGICGSAFAQQLDPSVLGLAPSTRSDKAKDDGMESNRYIKRPKPPTKPNKTREVSAMSDRPVDREPIPSDAQGPKVAPVPTLSNETVPQPDPIPNEEESPGITKRMRDLVLGGDFELIDRYRSFLDSEDIRKNIFEFSVGTSYLYNSSGSPYYFRNYINSSPGGFLGLDIWITPFLGIAANYRFSILNEIKDSPTLDNYSPVSHSWFDIGAKFRRFFGVGLNSSSLTFGLKYADYAMTVQPSSQSRLSHHTRGPQLDVDICIPSSKNYSWNFGIMAQPFLFHEEITKAIDLQAGPGNQTVGFGTSVGGEFRFSRQNRTFFKFSTTWYKSQFSGSSRATDPITGSNPSGTTVSNVFYFIDLGFRFGR